MERKHLFENFLIQTNENFNRISKYNADIKGYFENMSEASLLNIELIKGLLEKLDSFTEQCYDECVVIGVTLKTFIFLWEHTFEDQQLFFKELSKQIEEIENKRKEYIDSVFEKMKAFEEQNNELYAESMEKLQALTHIYLEMSDIYANKENSWLKTREMKKLYKKYIVAKEELLSKICGIVVFQKSMLDTQSLQTMQIKEKEQNFSKRICSLCECSLTTISSGYSLIQGNEKLSLGHKMSEKIKFREFQKPVFKPHVFKNKFITLQRISPTIFPVIIPCGIVETKEHVSFQGKELEQGTKLLLLDNSKRKYVIVTNHSSSKPFYIPYKSLVTVKEGPPSREGQICLSNY